MSQLQIGDIAPSFCLMGHDGSEYCLPELLKKGPVVAIFYPYDQSPGCTKLMCSINDDKAMFDAAGITLVGINNASEDSHRLFADKRRLKMPLLSDMDYAVAKSYRSLWQIGPIKIIRYSTIGIGQDGRIKYFYQGRPSNEDILLGMSAPVPA